MVKNTFGKSHKTLKNTIDVELNVFLNIVEHKKTVTQDVADWTSFNRESNKDVFYIKINLNLINLTL